MLVMWPLYYSYHFLNDSEKPFVCCINSWGQWPLTFLFWWSETGTFGNHCLLILKWIMLGESDTNPCLFSVAWLKKNNWHSSENNLDWNVIRNRPGLQRCFRLLERPGELWSRTPANQGSSFLDAQYRAIQENSRF